MIELFLPLLVGSLAFLSPCIVPMLTVYFGLITGLTAEELASSSDLPAIKRNIFKSTLFFIAGYSAIFILAGAAAGFVGDLLSSKFYIYFNYVAGVLLIILGLSLTGLFKLSFFKIGFFNARVKKGAKALTPLRSFYVGIIYAVACSHCIGTILAGMLVYAGSKGVSGGAFAMGLFSMGLAIPYLVTALGFGAIVKKLKKFKHRIWLIQLISGLIIIVFGVLVLTDNFGLMSSFFSKLLPYKFPGM